MGILFALIGTVLILFAIIGFFGASLWLAGAHMLAGLGLLGFAVFASLGQFGELLGRGTTRRSLRYGGGALLQTGVLTIVLILVAYLSVRHSVRWDWTEAKLHSLTQASREVLAQIPEEGHVEILAFYLSGGQDPGRELLELYTYVSDRVKAKVYDPNRRPDLAERFEIHSDAVMLVCNGACESAKGNVRVTQPDEQKLTRAIRSVISERKKVYFLSGHGEGDPEDSEAEGFSSARLALEDENIEVATLLLANLENVPTDADAVIVAGPDHSLLERELDLFDRYLRAGGGLLLLAEPIVVSNLEDQAREWGIELGRDIIVDQQIQLFAGPQLGVQPIVTDYGSHEITRDLVLRSSPTLFRLARSLRALEGPDSGDWVELARTGPASWAETDIERFIDLGEVVEEPESDRPGPVALAMARTFGVESSEAREGRLVVIGDADFASNRHISEFYNADLFLNATSWLVGDEGFISIERKRPRASTVVMTVRQLDQFRYLTMFVLPEMILLIGILNWWRRRT